MHTLITFLGRGRDNLESGYRMARYRFPDGSEQETPYFGLALADHIKPQRMVVLGTESSMWDVFTEHLASEGANEEQRLQLMEKVSEGAVTQALLHKVSDLLSQAVGIEVEPRLISMAREADEQNAILGTISEQVTRGQVSLDLTHGFRHLAMLGFLSAFMLERVVPNGIKIDGLWYGALDMTANGITPALQLDGLQDIQRWIDALNRFEAGGDYGVFADLLEKDGMPADKANCLREAAFCESTLNLRAARHQLLTALKALETPLPGASGLFQKRLIQQLAWARKEHYSEFQRALAMRALAQRDYLRTSLFGLEALISYRCEVEGVDPLVYENREQMRQRIRDEVDDERELAAYRDLNILRNAMAHGTPPRGRFRLPDGKWTQGTDLLKNRDMLHRVLQSCLDRLKDI